MACRRCSWPRSERSSRFLCMRMARSYSPRRRNRLPSAKCRSTVSGSTFTTSMKASIALSGCSFSRKLRPLKYELGSARDSDTIWRMSMRAAIQPRPKKSGKPSSHQYSNSMALEARRHRRRRRLGRRALAPEERDLAALAQHPSEERQHAEERAGGESGKQRQDERRLDREIEVEAQGDGVCVLGAERDQKHEYQEADRPGDDTHAGRLDALADGLRGALRLRRRGLLGRLVDALAQLLAGLEMGYVLLRHLHLLAGFGVAAGARRPVVQAEAAEAADLDAIAGEQRLRHRVEDHLDRVFRVLRHQLRVALRQPRDQLRLRHGDPSPLHGSPLASCTRYCCGLLLPLSSLARSRDPRLVAPALAAAFSVRSCFMASVSSERSFAFTERLIERFLRSTLMIMACTVSPSFRCARRSSIRSRENSEARR